MINFLLDTDLKITNKSTLASGISMHSLGKDSTIGSDQVPGMHPLLACHRRLPDVLFAHDVNNNAAIV